MAGSIYERLARIMAEVPNIGKDSKNTNQGYAFRSIDAMYNELHSLFAKEGVIIGVKSRVVKREERPNKKGDGIQLSTILESEVGFYAPDGSSHIVCIAGEGMDSGDKATNKATSACVKYALMTTFLIPTDEKKDGDADSPEAGLDAATEKIKNEFQGTEVGQKAPTLETITGTITAAKTIEQLNAVRESLKKYQFTKAEQDVIDKVCNAKSTYLTGGK